MSPELAGGLFTTEPPGKSQTWDFLFIFGCAGSLLLHGLSLAVVSRAYSLVAAYALLPVLAFYVAEHRLQVRGFQWLHAWGWAVTVHNLQSEGTVVMVYGLRHSMACGI